jgi:sulfite exporter TauE/SafE
MHEFTWISAFLLGLMGAPHCAGMCGGIVAALSLNIQRPLEGSNNGLLTVLIYNMGRLSSYTIAGMLTGGISAIASHLLFVHQAQLAIKAAAVLFMLLLGLYISGWWSLLSRLETMGGRIWKRIEPLARKFIPIKTLPSAYLVGLVWGWLPCGLVYTGLIYSATAGGVLQGGLLMLFFGLGTLPAMLLMGAAGQQLQTLLQKIWLRQLAGLMVILMAIMMAYDLFMASG